MGSIRLTEIERDMLGRFPAKAKAWPFPELDDSAHHAVIVCDPIVSAVAGDSHKNAETRRALINTRGGPPHGDHFRGRKTH